MSIYEEILNMKIIFSFNSKIDVDRFFDDMNDIKLNDRYLFFHVESDSIRVFS